MSNACSGLKILSFIDLQFVTLLNTDIVLYSPKSFKRIFQFSTFSEEIFSKWTLKSPQKNSEILLLMDLAKISYKDSAEI